MAIEKIIHKDVINTNRNDGTGVYMPKEDTMKKRLNSHLCNYNTPYIIFKLFDKDLTCTCTL
jgi:hypothetical protein